MSAMMYVSASLNASFRVLERVVSTSLTSLTRSRCVRTVSPTDASVDECYVIPAVTAMTINTGRMTSPTTDHGHVTDRPDKHTHTHAHTRFPRGVVVSGRDVIMPSSSRLARPRAVERQRAFTSPSHFTSPHLVPTDLISSQPRRTGWIASQRTTQFAVAATSHSAPSSDEVRSVEIGDMNRRTFSVSTSIFDTLSSFASALLRYSCTRTNFRRYDPSSGDQSEIWT